MLCAAILLALVVLPGLGLTEGDDTIRLARTIYTLGKDETYETKLMLGSVAMNRIENPWFPDTLREVLCQPHQFPHGTLYDEDSLKAARELMMGRRALNPWVVFYSEIDSHTVPEHSVLFTTAGNYAFYSMK